MARPTIRWLFVMQLAASLMAQGTNYIAYPVDALHTSFGNWAAFGVVSGGSADEARSQHLIPAHFLPAAGGLITALEVGTMPAGGTITYQRLDVILGSCPGATLSTNMDANLPAPQTVWSPLPGTSISWPGAQWLRITFTSPFAYVGGTHLVLETRKVVQRPATPTSLTVSQQHCFGPNRQDLEHPMRIQGGPGSGAANSQIGATHANTALMVRLVFAGGPTLTINSPASGTAQNYMQFRIGTSLTVTARGSAGELCAHLADVSLASSSIQLPPVAGNLYLPPSCAVLSITALSGTGSGPHTLAIPANSQLVGMHLFFQSVTGLTAFTWTNAVDAILQM